MLYIKLYKLVSLSAIVVLLLASISPPLPFPLLLPFRCYVLSRLVLPFSFHPLSSAFPFFFCLPSFNFFFFLCPPNHTFSLPLFRVAQLFSHFPSFSDIVFPPPPFFFVSVVVVDSSPHRHHSLLTFLLFFLFFSFLFFLFFFFSILSLFSYFFLSSLFSPLFPRVFMEDLTRWSVLLSVIQCYPRHSLSLSYFSPNLWWDKKLYSFSQKRDYLF